MFEKHLIFLLAGYILGAWALPNAQARSTVIDSFQYTDNASAIRAWRAMDGSPAVRRATAPESGLQFDVPFRSDRDRVYWDRAVQLDLSQYDTFTLEVSCPRTEAMRSLTIYLKSGDGWYIWGQALREPGRQTLHMMKADFQSEGKPAGWNRIEAIRISPWKGEPVNTTLIAHRFVAHATSVILVQGNRSTPNPAEQNVARRATSRISNWLKDMNIAHGVITEDDLTAGRLRQARWVILPYNPSLPNAQRRVLADFMDRGGRLMVFYSTDEQLASMMGFRLGSYRSTDGPGRWAAITFENPREWRMPERIYQESWNIRPVFPAAPHARIIAWWEEVNGTSTGDPAWTASDRGFWMSHILLQGDDDSKRAMLAGLLAHHEPGLWEPVARHALDRAGRIGPYRSFAESIHGIQSAAPRGEAGDLVRRQLSQAQELHRRMTSLYESRKYAEAIDVNRAFRRTMIEAYARTQPARRNELRGVWDHKGTGLYIGDWDRTARELAESGLNAIFVNMLWGGVAHYNSAVLPTSNTFRLYGDQLEQCIQAARKHGLEVHVWVVCWSLTGAPSDFVARIQREGRMMMNESGQSQNWLNPAHPDNTNLLVRSLEEVAARYDIDGIHLDYIRYPTGNVCYAPYSRTAFEAWRGGQRVRNWPTDALPGGSQFEAYRKFRVDQINLVVRGVHRQIKQAHPKVEISAAVWGNYPGVIHSIGQDWASWLERGEVDFVTPMNYTADAGRFATLTHEQLRLPRARGRVMPGIGVTSSESQLEPDQVIYQISELRRLGASGFVLFDLNNTLRAETLPMMRLGVTREPTKRTR